MPVPEPAGFPKKKADIFIQDIINSLKLQQTVFLFGGPPGSDQSGEKLQKLFKNILTRLYEISIMGGRNEKEDENVKMNEKQVVDGNGNE